MLSLNQIHRSTPQLEKLEPRLPLAGDIAGAYGEFATMVSDENPGEVEAHLNWSVDFNGSHYFLMTTNGGNNELWQTDGTTDGTTRVKTISPRPMHLDDFNRVAIGCCSDAVAVVDGLMYFVVTSGDVLTDGFGESAELELWSTDGTQDGTQKVKTLALETVESFLHHEVDLFESNGELVIVTHRRDCCGVTFSEVSSLERPYDSSRGNSIAYYFASEFFVPYNDALYFVGFSKPRYEPGAFGDAGLYRADPRSERIELVRLLPNQSCADGCSIGVFEDWNGARLVELDGLIYILSAGEEILWQSDGTESGTQEATTSPAIDWPSIEDTVGNQWDTKPFVVAKPLSSFNTTTPDGQTLEFDGYRIIAGEETLVDYPNAGRSINPEGLVPVSDQGIAYRYISLNESGEPLSGFHFTDGTEEGTTTIDRETYAESFAQWEDENGTGFGLLMENLRNQQVLPSHHIRASVFFEGSHYVVAQPESGSMQQTIWSVTEEGPSEVMDLENHVYRGRSGKWPDFPTFTEVWRDEFYFVDMESRLWKSNWTTEGTIEVANLGDEFRTESAHDGAHYRMIATDSHLFMVTLNGLWVTDGTESGTHRLAFNVEPLRDDLLFAYTNQGLEPPIHPVGAIAYNDKLFFTYNDPEHGAELWVSDGTVEGTKLAADISPRDSKPTSFLVWNDTLFFAANDDVHGRELWKIDLALAESTFEVEGDTNGDGFVDFTDFLVLSTNYLTETESGPEAGDLNLDGLVDFADFLLLSTNFGRHLEATS